MAKARKDTRGVIAIEFALIFPVFALMTIGGLWLGLTEIQIMGLRAGTSNVAAVAATSPLDQPGAAAMVCAVTPATCNSITTTFNPGSPGGIGSVTASLPIDLSVIPFLNLSARNFSVTQNWVVLK